MLHAQNVRYARRTVWSFLPFLITPFLLSVFWGNPAPHDHELAGEGFQATRVVLNTEQLMMTYTGAVGDQPVTVRYQLSQVESGKMGVGIRVGKNRPLRLRIEQGKEATVPASWPSEAKIALLTDLILHPDIGFEHLGEEEPETQAVVGKIIGGIVDLLGKIKIGNCKTKASCSCSNGSRIELTCKCGQSAICTEVTTEVCTQTPEGNDCQSETVCQAGCA